MTNEDRIEFKYRSERYALMVARQEGMFVLNKVGKGTLVDRRNSQVKGIPKRFRWELTWENWTPPVYFRSLSAARKWLKEHGREAI